MFREIKNFSDINTFLNSLDFHILNKQDMVVSILTKIFLDPNAIKEMAKVA